VVDVHAKVSGYIKHTYVDIGEKVRAGETLAILEVPELNAQLKGTVSEFARSKDVMAALDDVLGLDRQMTYELVEDNASRQPPPPDPNQLTQLALRQRPDLQALNFDQGL
jgi:multidrug efflux pump subunit AcrA (membrane-fusion protein)